MCRLITSIVAVAVIGGLAGRVSVAEEVKCEGTIMKIEGENVTVKTPANEEHQMLLVPATKIVLDGKAAKPTDLKIGQKVKCTCNKEGEKMTCNAIEASSPTQ